MHILSMKYMDFSNCLTKWRAFVSHEYGFSIVFLWKKPNPGLWHPKSVKF